MKGYCASVYVKYNDSNKQIFFKESDIIFIKKALSYKEICLRFFNKERISQIEFEKIKSYIDYEIVYIEEYYYDYHTPSSLIPEGKESGVWYDPNKKYILK